MPNGFGARVGKRYHETAHFFDEEIWEARLDELTPRRARRYRAARVLHSAIRGLLFKDPLHVRAAALTYCTVLSLVPTPGVRAFAAQGIRRCWSSCSIDSAVRDLS